MTILIKNKHTLIIDEFVFKCCIGKNGSSAKKKEGDKKTPKGTFKIENLYYRRDRIKRPKTQLKCLKITKNMGWCNDIRFPKQYNKKIKLDRKFSYEKLHRYDYKYNLVIPIKYNFNKPIIGRGSCIFIHLTRDYKPTAGCIALKEKDFLIMLKIIKRNSVIKIC